MNISQAVTDSHATAVDKGWWEKKRSVAECLCLIHSEVSEALEEVRDGRDLTTDRANGEKPCGFPSELADICIRVFDLAGHLNIDLEGAIIRKMDYNKTRPHRHGGKKL